MNILLNLILISIISGNFLLLINGWDIRKFIWSNFSLILGVAIFATLYILDFVQSIIEYMGFSVILLLVNIGIKFAIFGNVFTKKEIIINIENQWSANYLFSFISLFLSIILMLITFGVVKSTFK